MPITHEGLARELEYVTNPGEHKHIFESIEPTAPIMQEMAYELIIGNNTEVDRITQEALQKGFSANQLLDDGLLNGMSIVGVKFRDMQTYLYEEAKVY